MPRLPTKFDLPEQSISPTGFPFPETGASAIGKGISDIGGVVEAIGQDKQKEEDSLDLMKWEAFRRPKYEGVVDAFHQDNDYATFEPRAKAAFADIDKQALPLIRNPAVREQAQYKAQLEADGALRRIITHGISLRKQDKEVTFDSSLGDIMSSVENRRATPDDVKETLRHARAQYDNMVASGAVEPAAAYRIWERNVRGINSTLYRAANRRLWEDPYGTLRDLDAVDTNPSGSARDPDADRRVATDLVKRLEGYDSVAKWDYKQWTNGYGTKALKPHEAITRDEAERRFNAEFGPAYDAVRNRFPNANTNQTAALASLTYNAGPGWMQGSGLAKAVDAGDWRTAARELQGYNHAGGRVNSTLVRRRSEEGRTMLQSYESGELPDVGATDAGERYPKIAGDKSGWAEIYQQLSPQARRHLETNARTALHATLQQEVKDAAVYAERTGELPTDEEGKTVKDHIAQVLNPNQISKSNQILEGAINRHKAASGLSDMSPDEARKHIVDTLDPEKQNKEDGVPLGIAERNRAYAARRYEALRKAGHDDPWQYVTGMALKDGTSTPPAREVADAWHIIEGKHPDLNLQVRQDGTITVGKNADPDEAVKTREQLVEAGYAAQKRLGLPKRSLGMSDARNLLPFERDPKDTPDDQIVAMVNQAREKAPGIFGKYADDAVHDAIQLIIKGKKQETATESLALPLLTGRMNAKDFYDAMAAARWSGNWQGQTPAIGAGDYWFGAFRGHGVTPDEQSLDAQAAAAAATEGDRGTGPAPISASGEMPPTLPSRYSPPGQPNRFSRFRDEGGEIGVSPYEPATAAGFEETPALPGIAVARGTPSKVAIPSQAQIEWLRRNAKDFEARRAFDSLFPGMADKYAPRK